jgi:hypothetical protein
MPSGGDPLEMPLPAFLNRNDFNISLFFTEEISIAVPVFRLMTLVDIPHPLAYSLNHAIPGRASLTLT